MLTSINRERERTKWVVFLSLLCILIMLHSPTVYALASKNTFHDTIVGFYGTFHTWRKQVIPYEGQGSVFFAIITMPGDQRQHFAYNTWMGKINFEKRHRAVFVCEHGPEIPCIQYIHPTRDFYALERKQNLFGDDRNRGIKRMAGMKYFIEQTDYKWYWSATDDIVLDLEALEEMIKELDSKYDSEKDLVFQGHCIFNLGRYYIQGGSGFIVSRAAARILNNYAHEWIDSIEIFDDTEFDRLRWKLGLKVSETHSPYMSGHAMPFLAYPKFYEFNFSQCPKQFFSGECKSKMYPLPKLVAYHSYNYHRSFFEMQNIIEAKQNDNTLYYFFDCISMQMCRGEPYPL